MEKLINEENEWDHGISEVKEGPADGIRIGKFVAALKKMKSPNFVRVCIVLYRILWAGVQPTLDPYAEAFL